MNPLQLLFAEIRYRKLNFVLALLAISVAVGLFVAGPVLVQGYGRETAVRIGQFQESAEKEMAKLEDDTRKLMLTMGFNLRIVHKDTNMSDFWSSDFAAVDMPQEYADKLAKNVHLTLVTHLVATLQSKIEWAHRKVLLAGYLPESRQKHMGNKKPMGYVVEPGTVFLGYELGAGREVGQSVDVLGQSFRIAQILPEMGSKDDITIVMHLKDAQKLLNKAEPPKINQILAIGCNCANSDLPHIRQQLAEVMPDTQITEHHTIAVARAEQRELVASQQQRILEQLTVTRGGVQRTLETLSRVVAPLVVLACGVWVGLLALGNVRERKAEIGLLRAIGKGSGTIALLFLSKAAILGLLGAGIGFALGTGAAYWWGTRLLGVAGDFFSTRYDLLYLALLGAPLVSVLASYLPTVTAVLQDPSVVLRDA